MITFREGIEAFLIISVILLYLRQTSSLSLLISAKLGAAAGLLVSIAIGVLLADVGAIRPLYEGCLALAALVSMGMCFLQLNGHGKQAARDLREKVMALPTTAGFSSHAGMFGLSLLMIAREGTEAAIMLAAMARTPGAHETLAAGLLGLGAAIALGVAWMHYGRALNLPRFFQMSAAFMAIFSLQLVIYAFHEFTEAQALPLIDNARWHLLTEAYGPDGEYGNYLSYCLVVVPLAVLVIASLRQRFSTAPIDVKEQS
jgi:high-affinity iron transporter